MNKYCMMVVNYILRFERRFGKSIKNCRKIPMQYQINLYWSVHVELLLSLQMRGSITTFMPLALVKGGRNGQLIPFDRANFQISLFKEIVEKAEHHVQNPFHRVIYFQRMAPETGLPSCSTNLTTNSELADRSAQVVSAETEIVFSGPSDHEN